MPKQFISGRNAHDFLKDAGIPVPHVTRSRSAGYLYGIRLPNAKVQDYFYTPYLRALVAYQAVHPALSFVNAAATFLSSTEGTELWHTMVDTTTADLHALTTASPIPRRPGYAEIPKVAEYFSLSPAAFRRWPGHTTFRELHRYVIDVQKLLDTIIWVPRK